MLEEIQNSMDMTRIIQYTKKIEEINPGLSVDLATLYLKDFLTAMDITNALLADVVKFDIQAKTALKKAEAEAFLDRAADILKAKGCKDSAEARKRYVDTDPEVAIASDNYAQSQALTQFLKNKLSIFTCAHNDVKKIAFTNDTSTYTGM